MSHLPVPSPSPGQSDARPPNPPAPSPGGAEIAVGEGGPASRARSLSSSQKAAIVIHLLNAGGVDPGLSDLPAPLQARVTREIAGLGLVDRPTLAAVIAEFAAALDAVGHSFPAGLDDVLRQLAPHLSSDVIEQLSAEADLREPALRGPALWAQVARLDDEAIAAALAPEGPVIVAAALSRLGPARAARLLDDLPAERADAVALAYPGTAELGSAAMDRIGAALLRQAQADPPRAFAEEPSARVGEMLNSAGIGLRSRLLTAIESSSPEFAAEVRRCIFGFEDIPERLSRTDVPKLMRAMDRAVAVTALAAATGPMEPAAEFLLGAMPKRLAEQYRDDIAKEAAPSPEAADSALSAMIAAIRELEEEGEITLLPPGSEAVG